MKRLLILFVFAFACPALQARIHVLEPWSPGVDFQIPKKLWTHGAQARFGSDGTDFSEAAYFLNYKAASDWEVGGTLGYLALDRPGANGHSGFNDLTVASKYKFSQDVSPENIQLIAEAGLSLPTGDPDHGLGAGGIGILLGWGMAMPIQYVTGYAHLGLRVYTEGNDTRWGNVFTYVLGAQYELHPDWSLTSDLRGFNHSKDKIKGIKSQTAAQEVYLSPGVLYHHKKNPFDLMGNLLIGLSNESYDVGLMAGVKF